MVTLCAIHSPAKQGLDFFSFHRYTNFGFRWSKRHAAVSVRPLSMQIPLVWSGIEAVITGLTRNRPGDLEHPLAEILIFQGFPGLEKVRTSCFLS